MNHKKFSKISVIGILGGIAVVILLAAIMKTGVFTQLSFQGFALLGALFFVICIFAVVLILQLLDRPVRQILETIQQVERGDFTARCPHNKLTGLGSIAVAINDLIETMEKRNDESAELHSELASMIKNIPGGMFRCKGDENFTLLFVNKGFLSMLGYTEEELKTTYGNEFINIVHRDDRDTLRETVEAQRLTSETIDVVYRVYHANGGLRWVHQQGSFMIDDNGTWHDSVIIDITAQKQAQDAHLASESRYRLVMQATSDWICEFDLTNNRMAFDNKSPSDFLPLEACGSYDQAINYIVENLIYPEDADAIAKQFNRERLLRKFSTGKSEVAAEYRSKEHDGSYVWSSMTMIPIMDVGSNIVYCVAYFRNVNEQKNAEIALIQKAQSDSLTHLYNTETTQNMISSFLSREGKDGHHAMLVLDIDNFKHVNDQWGHLFGDAVLSGVSKKMKQLFRTTDILGRIGGDEFIIFLKDFGSVDLILQKTETLLNLFRESFTDENRGYSISTSIGISLYPQHGTTYTELMERADRALYQAKDAGKNGCMIYNMEETAGDRKCIVGGGACAAANSKSGFKIDNMECILMAYIFKNLFDSDDSEESIHQALKMIGEHYHASQVYIIANPAEDQQTGISYEWKDTQHPLTREQIYQFARSNSVCSCQPLFQQEGVYYCNDISNLPEPLSKALAQQNINFIMQFSMVENGELQGIAGIASCRCDICLTQSEIDALDILCRVIHLLLQKRRAL